MILKLIILILLLCVMLSLLVGFLNLGGHSPKQSKRLFTSLTVRVTLCVLIFLLLLYGFATGIIVPHPLQQPS